VEEGAFDACCEIALVETWETQIGGLKKPIHSPRGDLETDIVAPGAVA